MTRLSDVIEQFIKKLIENSEENELQLQRNELANYFSCAPSQINYVLTTRFTMERGYYIESKRGGGGCIVIKKIEFEQPKTLFDAINERIGNNLTYDSAVQVLNGLLEARVLTVREAGIIKAAINDRTLLKVENKNKARADILKAIIMTIVY